jgi:hypothetical protein
MHKTVILAVVLYRCETWSLTLREERRFRVFEYRLLRRIFGPSGLKRDDVMGGCRKLHYEELHSLYSSPNIIRVIKSGKMKWAGYVARMMKILAGKPEGKSPLGRPSSIWEDNIKMDLREWGIWIGFI